MSDPISVAILKSATELGKAPTEEASKVLGQLLLRFAGPGADAVGNWIAERVDRKRDRWRQGLEVASKLLDESGKEIKGSDDRILTKIFEGMSLEDNEDLRRHWAALLVNHCTGEAEVRPAFASILADLTSDEAVFLEGVHKESLHWPLDAVGPFEIEPDGDKAEFEHRVSKDNLLRLRLIEEMPPRAPQKGYYMTALGKAFMAACSAPRAKGA